MSDIENTIIETTETLSTAANPGIPVCPICSKHPCECNEFICPIHGRVKAKAEGTVKCKSTQLDPDDPLKIKEVETTCNNYYCSIGGCKVTRTLSEMEYPHRDE